MGLQDDLATHATQDGRIGELITPLGKDVLLLRHFGGTEGLGELFEFQVEAVSEQKTVNFDQALGQACTVRLKPAEGGGEPQVLNEIPVQRQPIGQDGTGSSGQPRVFNGILVQAQQLEPIGDLFHYRLVLRPWLALLGYKADCRIFLDKDVKEIIQDVFSKGGFNDFSFRTTEDYDKIPYCVQYRETDLAFVSRLMEQYGIYYFFEYSDNPGKHTMVLVDSYSSLKKNPQAPTLPYMQPDRRQMERSEYLGDWISERRFRTGKITFNDYNYLKPNTELLANKEGSENYTHSKLEVYDYPGKYDEKSKGDKFVKIRLEGEQCLDHRRYVDGYAASLFPGSLTTVQQHPLDSENIEFLVVRCSHWYGTQEYRTRGGHEISEKYHGVYEFLPSDHPFRMLPVTPKPRIYGIHTAKVVGKKGEESQEISTDENGHIWVQFYWDREPQLTCPIRCSQVWSGPQWGEQFIPRIGMEVVVQFLEGDPDRPLVTGCVYNGNNKFPYDLPANKTQSGLKSDSSKGHNGYNEFMFEDLKGSEFIRMHAEKDHLVKIENDQTGAVLGKQTWTVTGDRSWTMQQGNDNMELQLGDQTIKLDLGSQNVQAMQAINLSVCMGMSTIQITPASITISSPIINLSGEAMININAPLVNVGAVLMTPSLIAGAGICSGLPII
jgi:type VI secretion system secreted protein VgrG